MITISQKDEKVLRQIAKEIPLSDISSKKIKDVLSRMSQALQEQGDGVAIAAPQIGESLRIFVIAGKIFDEKFIRGKNKGKELTTQSVHKDLVFINPEIIKQSKDNKAMNEGCLSVRWLYGKIKRSTKATVRAYDQEGNLFEQEGTGLMAQIFQHEIDHLNGILFIDNAKNLKEIPPEEDAK